jgi:nucleoside-diphosphate-sugar epimerase
VAADLAGAAVWQCVDITKREQVRSALRDLQPRQVYHLAGATHVPRSWAMPAETLEANVLATHHLLDGLGRAGVRRAYLSADPPRYMRRRQSRSPKRLPLHLITPTA